MGFLEHGEEHKKTEEYLQNHPGERLRQAHAKTKQNKEEEESKRWERFEDTLEVIAIRTRWKERQQALEKAGTNLPHINRERLIFDKEIDDLWPLFDAGKLTALHPVQKPKSELEQARESLKKSKEKYDELERELKELTE